MPASLVIVLAQAQPPAPGSDRGEEFGKTSPIALVVILLLGIATFLLIRSMTKRLRNVPDSFDAPETGDGPGAPGGPGGSPGGPEPDADGRADPPSGRRLDTPSPGGRADPEG